MRYAWRAGVFSLVLLFSAQLRAGLPTAISTALSTHYPPAEPHKGLSTAYVAPDSSKLRGAVVILKGGIPAEKAKYFISWDDYDYRGVNVNLRHEGEISTRRGVVYTYLQPGDVMAVAGISDFAGEVYLKLISPDIYAPEGSRDEKRFSRVTVSLGFKIPKQMLKDDDAEGVLRLIGDWLKPFPDVESAKRFAALSMGRGKAVAEKTGKPQASGDERMKNLEEKIDAAKRQMEEAEKEMEQMKWERGKR